MMSSRASSSLRTTPLVCLLALVSACGSQAVKPVPVAPQVLAPVTQATVPTSAASVPGAAAAPAGPRPDAPAAARADFDRALRYMRAGNATEAELGFKQVALQYPQFA